MSFNLKTSYRQSIGILDEGGSLFLAPQSCRDYIHDAICAFMYPEYAQLWSIYVPRGGTGNPINRENPDFVVYTGAKSRERNAEKFQRVINELEAIMGIDGRTETIIPDIGVNKNSGPFIARVPNFWIRSPISVSALALFLRLSPAMKKGEGFDAFVDRMLKKGSDKFSKDVGYLRKAVERGVLQGFMERSLPCLNREGYSDYLLSSHGRGFAWYHAASDAVLPNNEEDLKTLRIDGRKAELNR